MQISVVVLIFYCFRTKFTGDNCFIGRPPPHVEESQGMDNFTKASMIQFWEYFAVVPCVPINLER